MASFAASQAPSDSDFKKNMSFRRRNGVLDWNRVINVDLEQVVRTRDVSELQGNLDNITFADFQEHDFDMFSEEVNVIQLFRLFQLSSEYLVNVQNHLYNSRDELQRKYDQAMKDQKKLLDAVEEKNAKIKALKKALKDSRKKPETEVFRCETCAAAFSSPEYLKRHIERRHNSAVPQPSFDTSDIVSQILEGIRGESASATARLQAELDAIKELLKVLSEEVSDGNDEVIAELRHHVDVRAKELLDEIAKLQAVPAPAPAPTAAAPEPVVESPDEDKERLRAVLRSRAELKHIWFKEFPFLKARYPAPPSAVLVDKVNSMRSVAVKTDEDAYARMQQEVRAHGFPQASISAATDVMVRNNYTPDRELLTMAETTRQASESAHEHMIATKERLLAQRRGVERERLHRVNAELRDYSTVRDKAGSPSASSGSEPAQVALLSPSPSAFRPALQPPSALPTPVSYAGSQGQHGQPAPAFAFTTPMQGQGQQLQPGQWQQHQLPQQGQGQWPGQFAAQSAPPTPARPGFGQQQSMPQQQQRMPSPQPQRQATAPASFNQGSVMNAQASLPPRAPMAAGR